MDINGIQQNFDDAKHEVKEALAKQGGGRPRLFSENNFNAYFKSVSSSFQLISEEPEILIFVFMQWATIILAYILWTQIFKWIPDDVWHAMSESSRSGSSSKNTSLNLIFLAWSLSVVVLASYPLAVCNAAIVAVHNLRACHRTSTAYTALALGLKHIGRLWAFTAIDGWITVNAILDRLPSKHYNRTALDELLYYAWKIATMTVVPSLVNGKSFVGAGKDAVSLFKTNPKAMLGLRLGYSAMCWVVGVLTYFLSILSMCVLIRSFTDTPTFYIVILLVAVPLAISVGVVTVFLRPPYLLGIARLYTDHIVLSSESKPDAVPGPLDLLLDWKTMVFIFLLVEILFITFFAEKIGFAQWVAGVARASLG